MKKIILFVLAGLLAGSVFAQDPGAAEKNAANAAWKAKDYAAAFTNFEKYLQAVNFADKAYIYNAAVAASKINNYLAAEKYFEMAIKNNYKIANSYLGKAKAEEDLNKESEMVETLENGLKAAPGNAKLETMYGAYLLKKGVEAQKNNNLTQAAESYSKILNLTNKDLKTKAYMALGSLYFNNGASILQKATPYANTEKERYAGEKAKADADFKKALGYVEQAKALDPQNADVAELMKQIKAAIK